MMVVLFVKDQCCYHNVVTITVLFFEDTDCPIQEMFIKIINGTHFVITRHFATDKNNNASYCPDVKINFCTSAYFFFAIVACFDLQNISTAFSLIISTVYLNIIKM